MKKIRNKQCKTCKKSNFASFENWANAMWGGGCTNSSSYPCRFYKPNLIGKALSVFKRGKK